MSSASSFYDREFARVLAKVSGVDMVDVKSRRYFQIVFRAQIPRHHSGKLLVVMQFLYQLASQGKYANRRAAWNGTKLESALSPARHGESFRLEAGGGDIWVRYDIRLVRIELGLLLGLVHPLSTHLEPENVLR